MLENYVDNNVCLKDPDSQLEGFYMTNGGVFQQEVACVVETTSSTSSLTELKSASTMHLQLMLPVKHERKFWNLTYKD